MSHRYQAVGWNQFKVRYDLVAAGSVLAFVVVFTAVSLAVYPDATVEIMLIRAFGAAAFLLLHVVLCVGPLARLNRVFLPVLYNRRHLGVLTFLVGSAHALLVVGTYHLGSDMNPILSIFLSDAGAHPAAFPFQVLGFFALAILFLMAATSHDFWLSVLSAPVWKSLHMLVYVAYALLVAHVAFGVLQAEFHPAYAIVTAGGFMLVLGLHAYAGWREQAGDRVFSGERATDGFVRACGVNEIQEKRARIVSLSGERVAIFRHDDKVSAVSNVCQHQNGPLGEGRIIDGCITCPWHGYQYDPATGASPPPFDEKVPTFRIRVSAGAVWVDPQPLPPGTEVKPAVINAEGQR